MKLTTLNFFQNFHCIAGDCKHSCCIGWEIDIDEDTLELYRKTGGEFGRRLSENIDTTGTPHFALTKDERCPFLNDKNLCDIILNLGEENLCQICSDHPRFLSYFSDRMEIGLGLCCEAAAKQVLSFKEKAEEVVLEEDNSDEMLSEFEKSIFAARKELFAIAQNRSLPFSARLQTLCEYASTKAADKSLRAWAAFYKTLERLDNAWDKQLNALYRLDEPEKDQLAALPDTPFEQLVVYFLYRHLPNADDLPDLKKRVGFAVLSCQMLRVLCAAALSENKIFSIDLLTDLARMYSAEIEYSEENMDAVLSAL